MRKLIVRIIHKINPKYFENMNYYQLSKWGIFDIYEGKIFFDK